MQRRHLLFAALGAMGTPAARAAVAPPSPPAPLHWRQRALLGLGTTLTLRAAHAWPEQAELALDAAVAAIGRVEMSMSLYRPDSELSRLNAAGHLDHPSADLLAVLRTAQTVSRCSGGRFDVTVQPLWALHARAQREGRLPSVPDMAEARRRVGWQALAVDGHRVALGRPGMAITCNGIAQGYAADVARHALRAHGVAHALINTGEFAAMGHNDRGLPWTLGIENPHDEQALLTALRTDGRAVATSADNRSAFTPDHRHHHIVDPATGDSPPELSSVTVLAQSAMLADALTKVMWVAGPQHIPRLAKQWGVGVVWVSKAGQWQATADVALA